MAARSRPLPKFHIGEKVEITFDDKENEEQVITAQVWDELVRVDSETGTSPPGWWRYGYGNIEGKDGPTENRLKKISTEESEELKGNPSVG
jgi:hypothetical protein